MKQASQQINDTWQEKLNKIGQVPLRLLLGTSLVIVNFFQNQYQQRQLVKIISKLKHSFKTNVEAKDELLRYSQLISSVNTELCPIMVKNFESEEYSIGLLINREHNWAQTVRQIRQHMKLDANQSASFVCGKQIVNQGKIGDLHDKWKSEDGILYLQYIKLDSYG